MDKEEFKRLIVKQWKQYEDGHSGYIAVNLETGNISSTKIPVLGHVALNGPTPGML